MRKFGEELLRRPSFADKPDRVEAYSRLAEEEDDLDRALEYVEAGRQAMDKMGHSHVMFDFQELHLRFARREPDHIMRLIQHIDQQHGKEPNVAQTLTKISDSIRHVASRRHAGVPDAAAPPTKKFPSNPPRNPANSGPPTAHRPAAAAENCGRRTKEIPIPRT